MRKLWIALMLIFALLLANASAYDSSFAFFSLIRNIDFTDVTLLLYNGKSQNSRLKKQIQKINQFFQ